MKFSKSSKRSVKVYEADTVEYWRKNGIFEESISQRPPSNSYIFYDGPPFITGVPHYGTLLSSIVKDAIPRYWTMKGKRVERRWGWDCHGLPAEVFTEQKLGIHDRRDIGTKVSLEDYILTCRENMVQTGSLWEDTIDRVGRWVNFEGAYRTMDKDYMESVWWAFKTLYEKGKIYEGERVLLYCVRDATPISKAEVAMDNSYQEVTDPSVYVKFKLKDEDAFLLAWTTTPWTLPANVAVAVNKSAEYSEVTVDGERFIVASSLLDKALRDERNAVVAYTFNRKMLGSELVGKRYEPLFEDRGELAHRVLAADYVTLDEGTGVVHLAPAYGEEDYDLAKTENLPIVSVIDDNGFFSSGEWQGKYVWEINKQIAKELHERGVVYRIEYIRHSYPHCHRCGTKLMYRAHPSWFMNIRDQKTQMLDGNQSINWFPEHIKEGRFANTVETAPDWNLSRDRFWATALPVWKGKDQNGQEHIKVVGSYGELKELSGIELEDYHRPWVDDVEFTIEGVLYHRVDKVLDCWFESGSMPFAQFHYPFENVDRFEGNFPGDFIAEYVGQVRAWFYYLHAVSIGLFGANSFKNVIVTGTLAGNDGRKMSKSYGNFTDPNELMDIYGADALRFLLLSSPVLNAEDYALQDKDVADIARKLTMIWNVYDFFTLYADVDKWEWQGEMNDPSSDLKNPLDRWIVSRIHEVNQSVDTNMQAYDIPSALKPILLFLDDASNWYVRRSRKRFWKSENDADKQNAYQTLHYVLVQLSLILAPFTPFLSEELYRKLTGGKSVHLLDWPKPGAIDRELLGQMASLRQLISDGLSQRAEAGIKVRQPLRTAYVKIDTAVKAMAGLEDILKEELNVKQVQYQGNSSTADTTSLSLELALDEELILEGLGRDIVRQIQSCRKEAGLEVDNRIRLALDTHDTELQKAIKLYAVLIQQETLSTELITDGSQQSFQFKKVVEIAAKPLAISLEATKA